MNQLPLAGIKVLEITHIVAGPSAGLILADMGADVVKIEPPDALDPNRAGTGRNGTFYFLNRNKRSIVIDLKHPRGKEVFLGMADHSDVVVENLGPGAMDRLGLGYEQVSQRNPGIIYCGVKGFLDEPYANRGLLDELAQMMSGLAYMTGPPGQPLRAGSSVIDIGAATYGVVGVLAALLQRQQTGVGQNIKGGLFETALFFVGQHMGNTQFTGEQPVPMSARDRTRGHVVYDLFTCADGRQVFIAVTSDNHWRSLCKALHLDDLLADPDLATTVQRRQNRDRIFGRIGEATSGIGSEELVRILIDASVPVAPLNTPATVLDDPYLQSRDHLFTSEAEGKRLRLPALPYHTPAYRFANRYDPPAAPGRDTREVLADAGYSGADVEELLGTGAVKEGVEAAVTSDGNA